MRETTAANRVNIRIESLDKNDDLKGIVTFELFQNVVRLMHIDDNIMVVSIIQGCMTVINESDLI